MAWTTGEIAIIKNKALLALADFGWEISQEEEIGHFPLQHYLSALYLSSAVEALNTANDFTDEEIEKIMSCLRKKGVDNFEFTDLDIITNIYSDSLTKGDPGPAGSDGADGATGATGATGSPGATGRIGSGYGGTSVTSYNLGASGSHSMILRPNISTDGYGLAYQASDRIKLTDNAAVNTYLVLTITSFNATTGQLDFADTGYETLFVAGIEVTPIVASGASTNWSVGLTGERGNDGAAGSTGATGTRGTLFTYGAGTPSVSGSEINGDQYLNTSNGDFYVYTGSWTSVYNIKGATGATGSPGAPGIASFYTQHIYHDTTAGDYTLNTIDETIGTGLNDFRAVWAGPDGPVHIILHAHIQATAPNSAGYVQIESSPTGGTILGSSYSDIAITANGDIVYLSTHIVVDLTSGTTIGAVAKRTAGGLNVIGGNITMIWDNA